MDVDEAQRARRDDRDAKAAFVHVLDGRGYLSRVTSQPADITAIRDGVTHYFEIKKTSASGSYFGAATLTEWRAAIEFEDRFTFVVAIRDRDAGWVFQEYTPTEFMTFSSIPPFKIFFHLPMGGTKPPPKARVGRAAVRLTRERLGDLFQAYARLRTDPGRHRP